MCWRFTYILSLYDFLPAESLKLLHLVSMDNPPIPATQAPAQTPSPGQPRARRLMSLDALRDFDMFWIVGGEEPIHGLYKAWPRSRLAFSAYCRTVLRAGGAG